MADYSRLWPILAAFGTKKTPLSARFWLLSARLWPFPAHTIAHSVRPVRRAETSPATPSRPRSAPSPPSFADGGPPHGSRGRGFADYEHRKPARTSPRTSSAGWSMMPRAIHSSQNGWAPIYADRSACHRFEWIMRLYSFLRLPPRQCPPPPRRPAFSVSPFLFI